MRINIIVGRLTPSGSNRNIVNLAKALRKHEDVHMSILGGRIDIRWIDVDGLNISHLDPSGSPKTADVYLATGTTSWSYLAEIDADKKFGYVQEKAPEILGRDTSAGAYADIVLRSGLVKPVAISKGIASWLVWEYRYDDVPVIGSRVNTDDFWREEWFPSRGKTRALIVGQYDHKSNQGKDRKFMAFRGVYGLDVEVFHVTPGSSMFADRVYAHWVSPRTRWLRRIYSSCDICVHATKSEGQPVTDQEVWACGVPLVRAVPSDSTGDILVDGYNCLLSDYGDDTAFRENIKRLCDDESLRSDLVSNGLETISRMPSFDEIAGWWIDVFSG